MAKTIRRSIIKDSKVIRNFIQQRMKELNLSPSQIVKDAQEKGCKIDSASFSKYLHKSDSAGGLSEESILFIAIRWGLFIHLNVSLPEYNEQEALNKLNTIFGYAEQSTTTKA